MISQSEWQKYKSGIDESAANTLFVTDLSPYVSAVNAKAKVQLSQNQFDALIILVFNIGVDSFLSSSVLKLVNDSNAKTGYANLESAWKAWNKSQGMVNKGLDNRRNAEWKIYSENVYKRW